MILTSNQVIFFTLVQILDIQALIVPDEVPSILSIVYSNIPTIKKGTDSRLGYGFRLGDRADLQFLMELGPQTRTRPLANQPDNDNTAKKRSPPDDLIHELYSKQADKREISKTNGGKWLEKWSESFKYVDGSGKFPADARPGLAAGEIDAKSVIPADDEAEVDRKGIILRQLQEGRVGKNIDDENALLNLLKLMDRIQNQTNVEKRIAAISTKRPNNRTSNNILKKDNNKVESNRNDLLKQTARWIASNNIGNSKKDDGKVETKREDLIKTTARRIASTIQNASIAASAVVNSPTSKPERIVLKSASKSRTNNEKDDMLMVAAQKIISTVNNATNVFSIVGHPPVSMVFNDINETVNGYSNKKGDDIELEKGTIMEKGAKKMASAIVNASMVASAFPNLPNDSKNAVDREDPVITYVEHFSDRRRSVKDSAPVNNLESSDKTESKPQKEPELDTKFKGRNINFMETGESDETVVLEKVKSPRKNEEPPSKRSKSGNPNSNVPQPNEGFLQYVLRRLGYYDYLMSYVPVVPEATREKIANSTQGGTGLSNSKTK